MLGNAQRGNQHSPSDMAKVVRLFIGVARPLSFCATSRVVGVRIYVKKPDPAKQNNQKIENQLDFETLDCRLRL